jgi:type II secretory pathway pseudopilin PulG
MPRLTIRRARRPQHPPVLRCESGESLVEVLIAIVILGIAGVAVLAGLQMGVTASDIHRKDTTGGAYVRDFAEAIQQHVATGGYQPCATQDAYQVPAVTSSLNLPAGFTATQDAADSVDATGAAAAGCVADTGVQLVTLHVASSDDRSHEQLTILLRKPCDPSVSPCTS